MIKYALNYVRPRVRRLSESELEFVGHALPPCLAVSCGPFLLLVDLPQRFQKHDQLPSVEDLNAVAWPLSNAEGSSSSRLRLSDRRSSHGPL